MLLSGMAEVHDVAGRVGSRLRVVVADDHDLFRSGLAHMLRDRDIAVVGEAADGRHAVDLCLRRRPQVVAMDLNMPVMDGVEATRRIVEGRPDVRVVMLTVAADDRQVVEAIVAGASGYLLKSAPLETIVAGLRAASRGEAVISPGIATKVLETVRRGRRPGFESAPPLSDRELEVLQLLVEGRDNAEIAERLMISPHTAKGHVSSLFAKLGVENRVQAAMQAVRHGLVP
jgi:DNA-binding NarL/FixJ family response regulator